jgi:hypothetical protein
MGKDLPRLVGALLMAAGAVGLAICLVGLALVAQFEGRATAFLLERLDLATRSLAVTADGLVVAGDSLTQAGVTLTSIQRTLQEAGQSLGSAQQVVDRVATVVGDEIPATLRTTRTALASAENAARLVDSTLGLINALLPGTRPAESAPPLASSIAAVGVSLDGLTEPLGDVEADLRTASGDLQRTRTQLAAVAAGVGDIAASLARARTVVTRYQLVVDDLQQEVRRLRAGLPDWLRLLRWSATALLILLGLAQAGLLVQGWDLFTRARRMS